MSVPRPARVYRVTWRRAKWSPATKANQRLYLRQSAALAFAEKIVVKARVTDDLVGVRIEYRDLEPGAWTDIQELEQ